MIPADSILVRMAEDMRVRNLSPSTIDCYVGQASRFRDHHGRPLDQLGPEEIRQWQIHLVDVRRPSWSTFNQAVCALRFLYEVTLGRPWAVRHIPYGKRPRRLPEVLSAQEASDLLQCTENLKHRMVLLVCYATGLRVSEATHLRVADIDGQRAQIRVCHGKGNKERRVPASPRLLDALRDYWRIHRPSSFLFPGKAPDIPLSTSSVRKACQAAACMAGIRKRTSPHTLRHSYATAMIEAGIDLPTISRLLGHSSLLTTMVYLHVRREHLDRAPSPIDWLPVRQCPPWTEGIPPAPGTAPSTTTPSTTTPSTPSTTASGTGIPDTPGPGPAPAIRRSSGRRPPRRG